MLPLVSVIVPVYNSATDLARCIESVRRQSYENLEILLVNDGSRDTSGEICRMYARIDERIRVIDKQNQGVSAARNDAIRAAKGKYLQFADSDDYLAQDAVLRMVEKAAHHLMEEPASFYYGVLWNKLYRADIIRKHDIRCNTDLSWSEDFLFNLEYIRYAERFAALEYPVYYYINNEKSITHTQMDVVNVIKTKATLFQYYKELYEHLGLYEKYKPQIYRYLISVAER